MKTKHLLHQPRVALALLSGLLLAGCSKHDCSQCAHHRNTSPAASPADAPHSHVHTAPHGGTVAPLGAGEYQLEFVRLPGTNRLRVYVLNGCLDQFIRCALPEFPAEARWPEGSATLRFEAVGNRATGETPGDTSCFEADLAGVAQDTVLTLTLPSLTVRSRSYTNVSLLITNTITHELRR